MNKYLIKPSLSRAAFAIVLISVFVAARVGAQSVEFVAIDGNADATVAYSTNGIDWAVNTNGLPVPNGGPVPSYWQSVCYGNGMFVATTWIDQAAYSTNGIDWTEASLPDMTDGGSQGLWWGVAFGNNTFVVVSQGDIYNRAAYSTNGVDWNTTTLSYYAGGAVVHQTDYGAGYGVFLASKDFGGSFITTNGINWATNASPGVLGLFTYGSNAFVALNGTNNIAQSTNGLTWTTNGTMAALESPTNFWDSLSYGNGVFVAVAYGQDIAAYSFDGENWHTTPMPSTGEAGWGNVTYGYGKFVALPYVGNNVAYSTNGIDWVASPGGIPGSEPQWIAVAARQDPGTILVQPVSETANEGSTATFAVTASGSPPIGYQWTFDGANINGGTNSSLTLSNVGCSQIGEYAVTVSNDFGTAISSNVTLDLTIPITAPSNAVGIENYPLGISGVSLGCDGDCTNSVQLNMWATNGFLQLGVTTGLTFVQGTNGGTTNLMVEGTISNLNAALSYLTYTPGTNFYGGDALVLESSCPGGGSLTNSTSVAITILEGPSSISNLVLWLAADGHVTLANGSNVATWFDQSSHSHNASQSSTNFQPTLVTNGLNGWPYLHFDASTPNTMSFTNVFLSGATAAEAIVVLRVVTNQPTSDRYLWNFGTSSSQGTVYPRANGSSSVPAYAIKDNFGSSDQFDVGLPSIPITSFHLYDSLSQSNSWSSWLNGIMQYTNDGNALNFGSAELGGFNAMGFFDGDIAEILMFNRALTSPERQTLGTYLNQKYACIAPSPPNPPTNIIAEAISPSQVSLSWGYILTNWDTSFSVERSLDGTNFSQVALVDESCSYVDTGLTAGTEYYYRVAAINYAGSSGNSSNANATTLTTGTDLPFQNLALWLKADAGCFAGNINVWVDQSGNGNNAVLSSSIQPMLVANVINGRPVVHFTATNSTALGVPSLLASAASAEAFVVLRVVTNQPTSDRYLWNFGANSSRGTVYPHTSGGGVLSYAIEDNFGSTNQLVVGLPIIPITQFHLYDSASQLWSWTCWMNGLEMFSTTNTNVPAFQDSEIGGAETLGFFDGDIAEILIFDSALTSAERDTVGIYLNNKYDFLTTQPPVPTGLLATGTSPFQMEITWSNTAVTNGLTFTIERSVGNSNSYVPVGTVWGMNDFLDWVLPGTNYFYRVRSWDFNGFSAYSSPVSPPAIVITNPPPETLFASPTNVTVSAAASDMNGSVAQVSYFINGDFSLTSTNAPYNDILTNLGPGVYNVLAEAIDNSGNSSFSDVVPVILLTNICTPPTSPPTNTAPVITLTEPLNAVLLP